MPLLVSSINWAYCRPHRFSVKIQNRENRGKGSTTFWHIADTHTHTHTYAHTNTEYFIKTLCRNCHSYFKFTPASYFIFSFIFRVPLTLSTYPNLGPRRWPLVVKNQLANALRDTGLISGLGRSPGEGQGNPLQCSCLENPHGQRSLVGYSLCG